MTAFFLMQCTWPLSFYFAYMHCGSLLKTAYAYTPAQVIQQNLEVSFVHTLALCLMTYLSYRINPLKILKIKTYLFFPFVLLLPWIITTIPSSSIVFVVQCLTVILALDTFPAVPIFIIHFPRNRRFTFASFSYALSRAVMHVITAFGIIYLTEAYHHYGLLFLFIPINLGFYWGLRYFERLEREGDSLKQDLFTND